MTFLRWLWGPLPRVSEVSARVSRDDRPTCFSSWAARRRDTHGCARIHGRARWFSLGKIGGAHDTPIGNRRVCPRAGRLYIICVRSAKVAHELCCYCTWTLLLLHSRADFGFIVGPTKTAVSAGATQIDQWTLPRGDMWLSRVCNEHSTTPSTSERCYFVISLQIRLRVSFSPRASPWSCSVGDGVWKMGLWQMKLKLSVV